MSDVVIFGNLLKSVERERSSGTLQFWEMI